MYTISEMTNIAVEEVFCPSEEALDILEYLLGEVCTPLVMIARSGYHILNPYHNYDHELQHVYWSYACAVNEPEAELCDTELTCLGLASLFHDHNHSGGKSDDASNIERAVKILPRVRKSFEYGMTEDQVAIVERLIRCTQFNGSSGFEREPTDFLEMCMRDADLMAIYSEEGRQLLLGLFDEFGTPLREMKTSQLQETLDKNAKFLREAPMYTEFGKRMKEYHLESALRDFAHFVKASLC